jgi:ribosomal protein L11 methyltransferase
LNAEEPRTPTRIAAWALRTGLDLETVSRYLPTLEASGLLGMAEEQGYATVYLPARVEALPVSGEWIAVEERDWLAEWKVGLEPITIGALTIAPPWAAREGDMVIGIAQAFGTGHHETTAGCLAALQELDLTGRRVLDVGAGSGILAIAAARLGADTVLAIDTDPLAVQETVANAEHNGVKVETRMGSLEAAEGRYDVVVANLDTSTIAALAEDLRAHLTPGGTLVASGVSVPRAEQAVSALEDAGLAVLARPGREWVVLIGRTPTTRPAR